MSRAMKLVANYTSKSTIDMRRTLTFWLLLILSGISTGQAMAAEVVISQTDGTDRLGGSLPLGQSFFASKTGLLKSIDLAGTGNFVANLRVYSGNGTGGTVLHEQTFTVPQTHTSGSSYTFTTLVLDEDVPITRNQRYTFAFYSVVSGSVGLLAKDGNPYSGGEFINNNGFNGYDMTFRVVQADDLPAVTLSVGNTTIDEDGGTATITATLDETFTDDVTVNLGFSGTATSGSDYAAPSATITIPAGDTSANASIGITASADTIHEGSETIIIDITGATNAEEDGTQQQTITITDDDSAPTVSLSTGSATIGEDGGSSTITASLSNPSSSAVTVNLSYSGTATSGTDYSTPSSSITVPAGQTTANAATGITATGDVIYEGNETVIIDISSVTNGSENGTQQQTITIDDAESPPTVTLSATTTIAEAAGSSTLTATLSTAADETVTVNLAYSGTASNGSDYAASSASISVTAGQTTGTATLTATQDAVVEDDETIIVDISSVTGASAAEDRSQQRTVTIIDDDNTVPTFTSFNAAVDTTNEDTAVEITFADLAAQGNEADAEGALAAFVVKAVSTGSLTINGSAFATGTNDQITASKSASWTPASNANGTLDAFTAVVLDGDNAESTPAVTAQVSVTPVNDIPTLTAFAAAVDNGTEDTAVEITYADLAAQGDEADTEGAVVAFLVKAVSTGSLNIDGSAFAVGSNDRITASKPASWTPASNANGTLDAFTVVALDGETAESASAITAQVSLTAVNDLPSFTTFAAPVDSTNEDTAVELTFADLAAQADETDVEGPLAAFVVKTLSSGTLTIDGSAFATGTNDQITTSKSATWTPASNANGTLDAFTVVARDSDAAETAPAITAQVSVQAVNDSPTLTLFADVVASTSEDTAVGISAADLATQGNEADVDGTVNAWIVKSVSSGSLTIGGSAFAVGTNDRISGRSTSASWTPAGNANGTLNAFTVVAVDDGDSESASPVTAQISVTPVNDTPTLTAFAAAIDTTNEDSSVEITFAELAAQGDEADPDGPLAEFVVKEIVTGTLTIGGTAFATGTNDQITASKSATWTPASNANGLLNAFTLVALDSDDTESATAVAASVSVTPVNDAPVIATNTRLTLVEYGTETISSDLLKEGDPDDSGDGIVYTVTSAPARGRLQLTTNSGVTINSFSQDDVDNNHVVYINNAGSGQDSFEFSLADGGEDRVGAATGTFTISVYPIEVSDSTEVSDTRQNVELHNPVINSTGVLIGGSVSGTVQNNGALRDVTVSPNTTVTGGMLQGLIHNSGKISDVNLGAGANIIGGLLTGQVQGDPDSPALLQSTIGPGAFVDNVIIGEDSLVDRSAILGANVVFDSSSTAPTGMGLTSMYSSLPWAGDPEQVQTVNLQDSIFSATGEEEGISLIRSIELMDQIGQAGIGASQDVDNGEFVLSGLDFNSTLLPVSVHQAAPDAETGLSVTEDGDVAIITTTNQLLVVYPALNNESAMRESLGDLTLEFDDRANLIIGSPDSETTYLARPDLIATPAPDNAAPGLQLATRQIPANTAGLSLVYRDNSGRLMQQLIPPVPADWMILKETLTGTDGVENVRIGNDGIIQLTVNGIEVSAIAEYGMTQSSSPSDLSAPMELAAAGDLNGDGISDVVMTFPNGAMQTLYLLP